MDESRLIHIWRELTSKGEQFLYTQRTTLVALGQEISWGNGLMILLVGAVDKGSLR